MLTEVRTSIGVLGASKPDWLRLGDCSFESDLLNDGWWELHDRGDIDRRLALKDAADALLVLAEASPVPGWKLPKFLQNADPFIVWLYRGRVWRVDEDVTSDDVKALVDRRRQKRRSEIERAKVAVTIEQSPDRRGGISDEIKIFVWQRDGGRCVRCGSSEKLEFDHIIPVVMGGADTARNLQILCEACNRSKGGNL